METRETCRNARSSSGWRFSRPPFVSSLSWGAASLSHLSRSYSPHPGVRPECQRSSPLSSRMASGVVALANADEKQPALIDINLFHRAKNSSSTSTRYHKPQQCPVPHPQPRSESGAANACLDDFLASSTNHHRRTIWTMDCCSFLGLPSSPLTRPLRS